MAAAEVEEQHAWQPDHGGASRHSTRKSRIRPTRNSKPICAPGGPLRAGNRETTSRNARQKSGPASANADSQSRPVRSKASIGCDARQRSGLPARGSRPRARDQLDPRHPGGRLRELLLAWACLRRREPPPIIHEQERGEYFAAMREAHGGRVETLRDLVHENAATMLKLHLHRHGRGMAVAEQFG